MAEARAKMIRHFVLSSPPGEIMKVIDSIRRLVPSEADLDSTLKDAAREFHLEHMTSVPLDGGNRIPIVPFLKVSEDTYFDSTSKTAYKVDPLTLVAEPVPDVTDPVSEKFRDARDAVHAAVGKAVKDHFGVSTTESCRSTVASAATINEDGSVRLCVSVLVLDEKNFWGGEWNSVFTTPPLFPVGTAPEADGTDAPALAGSVVMFVRYAEAANSSLRVSTSHKVPIRTKGAKTEEALAAAVSAALRRADDDAQTQIEMSSGEVQERALKRLRRPIPMTKVRSTSQMKEFQPLMCDIVH